MRNWFESVKNRLLQLVVKRPPVLEKDSMNFLLLYLEKGICPDCKAKEFMLGPKGGLSQNVECLNCGSDFNLSPFDGRWIGTPLFAERIGWNLSGRWESKGRLKAS